MSVSTEPIAYKDGDSEVRIDDITDAGVLSDRSRLYTLRISLNGTTHAYRVEVLLSDIMHLTDQQVAELLLRRALRKRPLFGFRGPHIP